MSDVKISALPAATAVGPTDILPIVQGGVTKKAAASLLGGGALLWTTPVDLTANQLNHLSSAPVELLAAPGAGSVIQVIGAWSRFQAGAVRFSNPASDDPVIGYLGAEAEMTLGGMLYETVDTFMEGLAAQENHLFLLLSEAENKSVVLSADSDLADTGVIATTSLADGGVGYAIGDTGEILGVRSVNATYEVDTVDGGGAVLTYHLTGQGAGYTVQAAAPTNPSTGIGTGLTINVDTITEGDGVLRISLGYRVVDVS